MKLDSLNLLWKLNWRKTLYFNFKYFPIKQAIHLPFYIYRRTCFHKLTGEVILNTKPRRGLVKLGRHGLGTRDKRFDRTILELEGKVIIGGEAVIGRGSSLSIGKGATLTLGKNFKISGCSSIICKKSVTFGSDCLLSWDILIMDTDFHHITNSDGAIINQPRPIQIGNHVWIGCQSTILKGVKLPDNVVVSSNSTLTKTFTESNCIIGGSGKDACILKRGINWHE